jgi:hypothetical protein
MYQHRGVLKTMSFGAFSIPSGGTSLLPRNSCLATGYGYFFLEHGAYSADCLSIDRSEDQRPILAAKLNSHPGQIILDGGTGTKTWIHLLRRSWD